MCWGVCLGLAQKEMSTDISSSVSTCKLFQNCLLMGFFLKCKNTQSASVKIILKLCNTIWFFNESLSIGLSFFLLTLCFQHVLCQKYIMCYAFIAPVSCGFMFCSFKKLVFLSPVNLRMTKKVHIPRRKF